MTLKYRLPMFERLEPRRPWRGGRITDTDPLTLNEAAREASRHAGTEVTAADFLRAAARGEITLRAIVHNRAKVQKHDGGIYCNQGEPTENTVPKGAIPTLPIVACQQLANAGRASWRTFEGFEEIDGQWCRFDVAWLADGEPDFETTPDDCRVIGFDVHALADAFAADDEATAPSAAPAAPTEADGKRGTRTDNLKRAIFDAWENGCPFFPASAIFDYLATKDATGFVMGRAGDELQWENSSGALSRTDLKSLNKRLPKYRKEYEKGA